MNNYRSVLETLKFSLPEDVLRGTVYVCKTWSLASNSAELWCSICETDNIPQSNPSFKDSYKTHSQTSLNLYTVSYSSIHTYNCKEQVISKRLMVSGLLESFTSNVLFFPQHRLFFQGLVESFIVDLHTNVSTRLSRNPESRHNSGLAYFEGRIYQFGGKTAMRNFSLQSCQQYDLATNQWMKAPNMIEARTSFTPCAKNDRIFLCGGYGTNTSEMFSPKTQTFKLLPFLLPTRDGTSVLIMNQETLLIIQPRFVCRFPIDSENRKDFKKKRNLIEDWDMVQFGDGRITRIGSRVFTFNSDSRSFQIFDFETMQVEYQAIGRSYYDELHI